MHLCGLCATFVIVYVGHYSVKPETAQTSVAQERGHKSLLNVSKVFKGFSYGLQYDAFAEKLQNS